MTLFENIFTNEDITDNNIEKLKSFLTFLTVKTLTNDLPFEHIFTNEDVIDYNK